MPTTEPPQPNGASDDIDTGEPLQVLTELEEKPDSEFLDRVRTSIGRRNLASSLVLQVVYLPFVVLFELLNMLFSVMNSKTTKGGTEPWNKDSN